jgi:acyl-coenzyme A thioesterase PaaI-like protein
MFTAPNTPDSNPTRPEPPEPNSARPLSPQPFQDRLDEGPPPSDSPSEDDLSQQSFTSDLREHTEMTAPATSPSPEPKSKGATPTSSRPRNQNKMMQMVSWLLDKAEHSKLALFVLNQAFLRAIPFNRPHGIKITSVKPGELQAGLPYKRKNMNHLRGLHACALATVSEFTSGVLLARHLDPSKYRIIMDNMKVEYHYQGKSSATAVCELDNNTVQEKILDPISQNGAATFEMETKTYDSEKNHLSTATITWHVKPWENVRTRR